MGEIHQRLLDPATYPEATRSVAFKETHISRIYLTDSHAYKFKKSLDLGFLDFSTLEKRQHFCTEEVRLNRRFTDDIYLGVVTLRQHNGRLNFTGRGQVLDHAVRMRRLPEDRMLNSLIEHNAVGLEAAMAPLGSALRRVFASAQVCRSETTGNVEMVRLNSAENFRQTRPAIGKTLSAEAHGLMYQATQRDLDELNELMLSREAAGYVRDGHGDLHTANICMTEPICIYDCIEFNRRFRVADLIADLAFLLMDLEFLGRRDLADRLVADYRDFSCDHDAVRLLPFYKRYRAWVRGKVDAMLACGPETTESTRDQASRLACRYFNLSLGYLLEPTLFLTCGLMGVGKTSLSHALAAATGARHLRADVVRKRLAGLPDWHACPDDFGEGLYSADMTRNTYAELFRTAAEFLSLGNSVIVDASFASADERLRFIQLTDRTGCPAWLLHLDCPEEMTLARLDKRSGDASDGRRELFARQRAGFAPIIPGRRTVHVDTLLPVDYNVQSILCRALANRERLS